MSFASNLALAIEVTGKSIDELKALAEVEGYMRNGRLVRNLKSTPIVNWLKNDLKLTHGQAMAVLAAFRGQNV